jgi:hypothetical protein
MRSAKDVLYFLIKMKPIHIEKLMFDILPNLNFSKICPEHFEADCAASEVLLLVEAFANLPECFSAKPEILVDPDPMIRRWTSIRYICESVE